MTQTMTGSPSDENIAVRVRRARVRRPWLVIVLAAGTLLAGAAAAVGLWLLSNSLAERPITVVQGAGELGAALESAPWIGLGGAGDGDDAIWILAPARCGVCAQFYAVQVPALERAGRPMRLIVASPRDEQDAALNAWIAQAARARDPAQLAPLLENSPLPAPPASDGADAEGHLEWGRASLDRIGAILQLNGQDIALPAIFWKRGPEWRALTGADASAADYVRREL